jgi:hypothetical protein
MLYLVFETEADAKVNEGVISANMGCSIVGRNARTGEHEPDKQQTVCWAEPVQREDGKWCFAAPAMENMAGVSDFVLEEYSSDWFPVQE